MAIGWQIERRPRPRLAPVTVAVLLAVLVAALAVLAMALLGGAGGSVGGRQGPTGVVVDNFGAASADVGGNVVIGHPDGSPATITTGDATAVGNASSTGWRP